MSRLLAPFLTATVLAMLVSGCSVEPEPIAYGQDVCHYCRMTIVDQTHAAQLVTRKGKQFKYDSIECLVNNLSAWDPNEIALTLVADYSHPGSLVDARSATFLISENIRSPMGANLSAFASRESAQQAQSRFSGTLFDWHDLPDQLKSRHASH